MTIAVERTVIRIGIHADRFGNAEIIIQDGIDLRLTLGIFYQLCKLLPVLGTTQHIVTLVANERCLQPTTVSPCPLGHQHPHEHQDHGGHQVQPLPP